MGVVDLLSWSRSEQEGQPSPEHDRDRARDRRILVDLLAFTSQFVRVISLGSFKTDGAVRSRQRYFVRIECWHSCFRRTHTHTGSYGG